ncbi:hypothetical protein GQ53DRAFT_787997 [Thozetella sp. PMI_491]|nr:hypothetical protein GQ53DRAFT_787997 [Thozetella sp. PMI_491]
MADRILPEVCTFVIPTNCQECQRYVCKVGETTTAPSATATPAASTGGSTNVGAIAGGAVAGVVAIIAISFLVWKFCVKNRREPLEQDSWDEQLGKGSDAVESGYTDREPSVRTRHSIASTVLTRASNIIQIAYIPGVTNRATPTSPGLLVPPVPPIPIAVSQASSPAATEDQHFFVPGDLRDSTYSNMSGYTDRTSYARTSYAPRSSVASTIYGKNPVIIAPAQTGMRVKPGMVSVKSATSGNSAGTSTPPVPSVDYEKYNSMVRPPSPSGSTFSVGSTFLNNASAHTATPAKAMVVRVGNIGPKKSPLSSPGSGDMPSPSAKSEKVRDSSNGTLIDDSPTADQGPFSDPVSPSSRSNTSLSAVIEEATRRASQRDSSLPIKGRERSPFGDEHATQD